MIATLVEADRAHLLLGQVAALAAEADTLLHLFERGGEGERFFLRTLQDVEREPLCGARADARQLGELRHEVVHGRAEHRAIVPGESGRGPSGVTPTCPEIALLC